jgi:hypothetical protein
MTLPSSVSMIGYTANYFSPGYPTNMVNGNNAWALEQNLGTSQITVLWHGSDRTGFSPIDVGIPKGVYIINAELIVAENESVVLTGRVLGYEDVVGTRNQIVYTQYITPPDDSKLTFLTLTHGASVQDHKYINMSGTFKTNGIKNIGFEIRTNAVDSDDYLLNYRFRLTRVA